MPKKSKHKRKPAKRIRVRSKSLAQIDETKLSLALWLMAKRMVEEGEASEEQHHS
jgi:hypothetical protein